jgi:small subunit ribosomal protein S1
MEKMTLDMIEGTFKNYTIGKITDGTVIEVLKDGVLVNIGGKDDAFVYNEDLVNKGMTKVGDNITTMIVDSKDENGFVKLSQIKAKSYVDGQNAVKELNLGKEFNVEIKDIYRTGISGNLGDYFVFIPSSQVEYAHRNDLKFYQNKTVSCSVVSLDTENKRITASIRDLLKQEKDKEKGEFWDNIEVGQIVKGKVVRMESYGFFVNVNGVDCLLHISELSYDNIKSPDEVLKIGDEKEFIVLSYDKEMGRVGLGYKQLQKDTRKDKINKYEIGMVVNGVVDRIMPYGAFIKLDDGLSGLLHITEIADKKITNVNAELKVGQELKVKVIDVDKDNCKLSLSLKAMNDYDSNL